MTLYRQLIIFIGALFFILFSATVFVKFQVTRSFLIRQLETHAEETATSLGLSISSYLGEKDLATVDTMMNAIFDSGYYRKIELVDLEGKILLHKEQGVVIHGVPGWFVEATPLPSPAAETLVTSGWRQMGHLRVASHPGYAYQSLWKVVVNMAKIFVVTGLVAMAVGIPILRILFRPLSLVEQQASALCKKQYTMQQNLPKTRELRRVVMAMNTMVAKVKSMFEEHVMIADRLGKNVYEDALTGLGNRRYFTGQVKAFLKEETTGSKKGGMLLIEVQELTRLNQERGYEDGDLLLQKTAQIVARVSGRFVLATAARLSGGSFALFLPNASGDDTKRVATETIKGLMELAPDKISFSDNVGHVGGVFFEAVDSSFELLAEADRVLRASQNKGPNEWRVEPMAVQGSFPLGEQQWQELLEQILAREEIHLFAQKIMECKDGRKVHHVEIYPRIKDSSGAMLSANSFVPLAQRLNHIAALDTLVTSKALLISEEMAQGTQLAINVSASSLGDGEFTSWVTDRLRKRTGDLPRVVFEFAEFSALNELELLKKFSSNMEEVGCGIGIDHFGKNIQNFGYLQSLRPEYVKIDRAFTEELEAGNSDSMFFIQALTAAAHSLDILVIAKGVESKKQFETLCGLNIDAVQGYYIDKPHELSAVE